MPVILKINPNYLFQGELGSGSAGDGLNLSVEEWQTVMLYVLTNLSKVLPYMK